MVIRPRVLASYEELRVFLGTRAAMHERPVQSVMRQQDGGSTWITFTLDGEQAELVLPARLDGSDEPDTFEANSTTLDVERLEDDDARLTELDYFCL